MHIKSIIREKTNAVIKKGEDIYENTSNEKRLPLNLPLKCQTKTGKMIPKDTMRLE